MRAVLIALSLVVLSQSSLAAYDAKKWALVREFGTTKLYRLNSDKSIMMSVEYRSMPERNVSSIAAALLAKDIMAAKATALKMIGINKYTVTNSKTIERKQSRIIKFNGHYINGSGKTVSFYENHYYANNKSLQILYSAPRNKQKLLNSASEDNLWIENLYGF